jgi:hypothetical protein
MFQSVLSYHLTLDKFPTIEFNFDTKIPIRVGESVMLHAKNCRVVARVKHLCRSFSLQTDELGNTQGYREIDGLDAWDNYSLEDSQSVYGELEVEKLLASSSQDEVDEIPDFGTFAEEEEEEEA